jgi:hypothetical protein
MAFPEERKAEWDAWVRRRAAEKAHEKAEDEEREREAKEADAEAQESLDGTPEHSEYPDERSSLDARKTWPIAGVARI